jgi:hypothetical protein
MRALYLINLLLVFCSTLVDAAGSQFPVVNGVIGGVPTTASKNPEEATSELVIEANTPGTLRVTENSGICGNIPRFGSSHESGC